MKYLSVWILTVVAAMAVAVGATMGRAEEAVGENDKTPPDKEESDSYKVKKATAEGYNRTKFLAKHRAMAVVKRRTHGRYRVLKTDYTYHPRRRGSKWTCTVTYEYWD